MKTLRNIIRYCPNCNQKKIFRYIGDMQYQIILGEIPKSRLRNRKITLELYGCSKCKSTLNHGCTI